MGCGGSSTAGTAPAPVVSEADVKQNSEVQDDLIAAREEDKQVRKLLLLGAGGSGKSTFFKQLQKLHGGGFQARDKKTCRSQITEQLVEAMKIMIGKCEDLVDEDEEEYEAYIIAEELEGAADDVLATRINADMTDELASHLKALWADPAITKVYEMRNIICVPDSTEFFMDRLDEIAGPSYEASDKDLLMVRYRTAGMTEKTFTIEGNDFKVVDVGGQRNERRKWIHFFDGVTAVLFVASLSCYDEAVFEDETANGMLEALEIFDEHCNSHWFENTAFILFLNKKDVFDVKIKTIPITKAFPEYTGEQANEASLKYIEKKFLDCNASPDEREIYTHVTQATDSDNVKKVFNDVQHIVINFSLQRSGLL